MQRFRRCSLTPCARNENDGDSDLTNKLQSWLAHLSDPAGVNPTWSPAPFQESEIRLLDEIIHVAGRHNVRPALAANLIRQLQNEPEGVIATASGASENLVSGIVARTNEARLQDVARAMLLKRTADSLLAATSRSGVPVALVKGIDFAERAYGGLDKRTFSDIDLLVPKLAQEALGAVLRDHGFIELPPRKMRVERTERQWVKPETRGNTILVEVHTDMIHDPVLRRHMTLTHELYSDARFGGVSPAARLVLAALHGAASHLFGRLQYAVDGLMIARMGVDATELDARAGKSGAFLPLSTMLRLGAEIYGSPECRQLLETLPASRWNVLEKKLIPSAAVLAAKGRRRWLLLPQRYLYRRLLRAGGNIHLA